MKYTRSKEKRKIVKGLIEKSRNRFKCFGGEVATLDAHQKAAIGIAVVENEGRVLNSLLDDHRLHGSPGPGRAGKPRNRVDTDGLRPEG